MNTNEIEITIPGVYIWVSALTFEQCRPTPVTRIVPKTTYVHLQRCVTLCLEDVICTVSPFLQAEDSVDDDVLNSFCWMYSSFDMPETFQFPCARKKYDGTYLYNTYYQWVSIFLAFNAGLFYIPRCIWLIIEGGLMSYMVKGKLFFHHTWMTGNFRSAEKCVCSSSNEHCMNAFSVAKY